MAPPGLIIATLIGGALAAGGANAVNMYVDRDIDAKMERTQEPPARHRRHRAAQRPDLRRRAAQSLAFAVLWSGANPLSAVLALAASAFYIGVYTLWLKRTSRQNIVIGGAAGAVPVLVGWAAVQNSLDWPPLVLFVAMFLWTPPHFWALAVKYADDYRAADVPMLPTVIPLEQAVVQMIWYTVALVITTLVLDPGRRPRLDLRRSAPRSGGGLPRRHRPVEEAPHARPRCGCSASRSPT